MSALAESDGGIVACWSCRGPVGSLALFCHTCGAVQPPRQVDHFARLGLARGFEIDLADLDRRYFGLQRNLHPDRFARRTAKERAIAESQAASLNQAYETLKEPLRRAEYLLSLRGRAIDGEATISDPKLLMEAMEWREELAEAEDAAAVDALVARAAAEAKAAEGEIDRAFADDDLDGATQFALRLRYLSKLIDEARARRVRIGA